MCLLFASEVPLGTRADTASQAANHHIAATSPDLDPQIHFRCCKCDDCSNAEHIPCLPVCMSRALSGAKHVQHSLGSSIWKLCGSEIQSPSQRRPSSLHLIRNPKSSQSPLVAYQAKAYRDLLSVSYFLFAFVCIALILQDPRTKFIQLWDGRFPRKNSCISKWHKKTETNMLFLSSSTQGPMNVWIL